MHRQRRPLDIEIWGRPPNKRAVVRSGARRSRFLKAALAAALVGLASCDDQIAVEQRVANAQILQQKGDLLGAIGELKQALRETPDDPGLRLMLGKLYLSGSDLPYAEKELGRARALGLTSPELMLALGELWLRQRRAPEVLDQITPQHSWPDDARVAALDLRARALLRLDDFDGARRAYRAMLDVDPGNLGARIGLIRTAMRAGDPDAGELLADALSVAPDHARLLGLGGDLAFQHRQYADATEMYRKRVAAVPHSVTARLALAEALIAAGELAEANALIDQILAERPGNGLANYLRAAAAFQGGDLDLARIHSERAVEAIPTHVPSMFLAGASNYALGRLEAAHWNLEKVLAREPDHAPAKKLLAATNQQLDIARSGAQEVSEADERMFRVDLAVVDGADPGGASGGLPYAELAEAGRLARARDHAGAGRILARLERAARGDAAVLELRGCLALLAGRSRPAIADFRAAFERSPTARRARKLALAQWQAGEPSASEATLETWLASMPDDLDTRLTLAELYLARERPAAAAGHLMKVVIARPTDATALNNLAWALLENGQPRAARAYAERAVVAAPYEPRAMDTLALVLTELGELDRAVTLLERASLAEAADPAIEAHLAQALAKRGDRDQAVAILRRLLAAPGALAERDQAAAEALFQELGG